MRKHLLFFFVAITVLLTCSGCATALYIGGQCNGNAKYIRETNVKVFGNILNGDCELMKDIWDGPDDYVLPPWLDRSLTSDSSASHRTDDVPELHSARSGEP